MRVTIPRTVSLALAGALLLAGAAARGQSAKGAKDKEAAPIAGTGSAGEAPNPEHVLQDKGLTKAGKKFILAEDEKTVRDQFHDANAVFDEFQVAWTRLNAVLEQDAALQMALAQQAEYQQEVNAARSQARSMPGGYGRFGGYMRNQANQQVNAMQNQLNALNNQVNQLRRQQSNAQQRKQIVDDFQKQRSSVADTVKELQEAIDPLLAKYHDLNGDSEVKAALATLSRSAKVNVKVAPSDALLADIRRLKEVKQALNLKTSRPAVRSSKGKAKAKTDF
jgi:hypothetical protein